MRAGGLQSRRYKVRRRGGWVWLVTAGIVVGAVASAFLRGELPLPAPFAAVQPAATSAPERLDPQTRTLTLPGRAWYALQLGLFDSQAGARAQAESFLRRGAGGYVLQKDGWRVLAAAYPARADAQAVQTQLKTQHGVETAIVEVLQPQVTLRLTGQPAQLSALADSLDAVGKLTDHLYALSAALDRREADSEAVLDALRSERDTLAALEAALEAQFGQKPIASVAELSAMLFDARQALNAALNAPSPTQLGARVKYGQLLCVCRMAAYANGLGAAAQ